MSTIDLSKTTIRGGNTLLSPLVERSALEQCAWLNRFPLRGRSRSSLYTTGKRVTDLVLVLAATPLLLFLAAVCALALKLEDRSAPVLFDQKRTGQNGSRFKLHKFRTMVPDAEALKETLNHLNQRQWPDFKIDDDPRITRVGRVLRKLSLDEIPQFVNVLRGEMSLVGPRPTSLPPQRYEHWQKERFDAAPGITGLWQVAGRESTSFIERIRLDISYVERRSFLLDLVILVRTVPTVIKGKGSC